jgi:hypothetical protein
MKDNATGEIQFSNSMKQVRHNNQIEDPWFFKLHSQKNQIKNPKPIIIIPIAILKLKKLLF